MGGGKPILNKLLKMQKLKEIYQKIFDNNFLFFNGGKG